MVMFRKAAPSDFPRILALQKDNLIQNLSSQDQRDGFLSIEYSHDQLERFNNELGIFIAIDNDSLSGYLIAQSMDFAPQSPLIDAMVRRFPGVQYQPIPLSGYRTFIYGPVCINRQSRGQGVLEGLFNAMLQALKEQYDVGVAFVSELNSRSLHAHQDKLGMEIVDEFEFNGQKYWTLVFEVKSKVQNGKKP
jgi:hypothetical protein